VSALRAAARPVGVVALAGLALVALGGPVRAESPADTEAADTARAELRAGRLCPDGLGQIASWEPIEISGNKARVAFALAAGCRDVEVSLISYEVSSGRGSPTAMVLDATSSTFSSGEVGRLDVLVAGDCAFRVAFLVGKPSRVVEATAQNPDACMFGAPVVATPGNRTPAGAPSTTKPAPASTGPQIPPATTGPKPKATRPEPAAAPKPKATSDTRPVAEPAAPKAKAPAKAAPKVAAPPAPERSLASEPVAARHPGELTLDRAMTEGWDLSSLLTLAVTALLGGLMLLRAARRRDRMH
jgi:hypothetical protein